MSAVSVLLTRLTSEEGERMWAYDDATGARVRAPEGNLTWGRGFNLDACGSSGLFDAMELYLVEACDKALQAFDWYASLDRLDGVRASVCLDIAYNGGVHGLLNYPHMITALAHQDWTTAAKECAVSDPKLDASRYAPLRQILLTGTS